MIWKLALNGAMGMTRIVLVSCLITVIVEYPRANIAFWKTNT